MYTNFIVMLGENMININIKIKAKEIINLKLTNHFKYNEHY